MNRNLGFNSDLFIKLFRDGHRTTTANGMDSFMY